VNRIVITNYDSIYPKSPIVNYVGCAVSQLKMNKFKAIVVANSLVISTAGAMTLSHIKTTDADALPNRKATTQVSKPESLTTNSLTLKTANSKSTPVRTKLVKVDDKMETHRNSGEDVQSLANAAAQAAIADLKSKATQASEDAKKQAEAQRLTTTTTGNNNQTQVVATASGDVSAQASPQNSGTGTVYDQFIAAGGTQSMWQTIVMPESGGNPNAVSPNGYHGLGQTMQAWGYGDVATQTAGMLNYAASRYGSIDGAIMFRQAHGWW